MSTLIVMTSLFNALPHDTWFGLSIFALLAVIVLRQNGIGRNVKDAKNQVTNGGSNLAITVGEIKANVEALTGHVATLRGDVYTLGQKMHEKFGPHTSDE